MESCQMKEEEGGFGGRGRGSDGWLGWTRKESHEAEWLKRVPPFTRVHFSSDGYKGPLCILFLGGELRADDDWLWMKHRTDKNDNKGNAFCCPGDWYGQRVGRGVRKWNLTLYHPGCSGIQVTAWSQGIWLLAHEMLTWWVTTELSNFPRIASK